MVYVAGIDMGAKSTKAVILDDQRRIRGKSSIRTRPDFVAIAKNAQSMLAVGYLEKWLRSNTPGYQMFMKDFEYANRSLTLAVREKKLDGATVAYIQLTLSCVHCHRTFRVDKE